MFSFWIGISVFALLGLISGLLLSFAAHYFTIEQDALTHSIDNLLPQSQCGQCGYPGCKPYAEAIALSDEKINQCIPGGEEVIQNIAKLLGIDPPDSLTDKTKMPPPVMSAIIDENNCIGCTKCIKACPVDAIIGSHKTLHTVLSDLCTGCELCIAPCPTHCISMQNENMTTDLSNHIPITFIPSTK